MKIPLRDRLFARVNKTDFCWVWFGSKIKCGYGNIYTGPGRTETKLVHRVSWELHHGPIPEGMLVCHECDNPPCVRPEHLFLGTDKDNNDDCMAKGRHSYGEKHPTAKLTEKQVIEIKKKISDGKTLLGLSKEYDISRTQLREIRDRESWKHIPETTI